MTRRRVPFLFVLIIVALFIATAVVPAGAKTIRVTHELGTTELPANPQRVVVFDYGVLDTLDRLGVDVVGLPKTSLPAYLSKFDDPRYTNAGTLQDPDFEVVHALKPDLIIISGRMSAHYDQLRRLAPTLYVAVDNDDYVPSLWRNVQLLGDIFGVRSSVDGELNQLHEQIEDIRALSRGKNALVLLVTGGRANAYGPGSRYGFIYNDLGLEPVDRSIVSSTHGQVISWEYVLVHDPDMLLVVDRDAVVSGGGGQTAKQVVENELVKFTKAYMTDNITYLDPSYWYLSGGGLTSFKMMLEDIRAALTRVDG